MVDDSQDIIPSIDEIESIHDTLLFRRDRLTSPFDGAPEFWFDVNAFLKRAQHGGILLDRTRDRRAAQGILDYWGSALVRAGELVPDLQLEPFDPSTAPKLRETTPCPYQGLEAFAEERSDYFFGRESLVEGILQKVKAGQCLFLVSGASGSGKSSLLRAGVIPRLRKGEDIHGSENWCYVTMVPGSDPVHSLSGALEVYSGGAHVDNTNQPVGADTATCPDQDTRLVILVDQFEEVFTLCNEGSRNKFVGWLNQLVQQCAALVLLTIRDDYRGALFEYLPKNYSSWILAEDAYIEVDALSLTELRSAIEKPAEKVGLRYDDGIVDDLAGKVLGHPAGLPLLQFTLIKLWDNLDRNRITKRYYDSIGDPLHALQNCAEKFYDDLIPEDQYLVKNMLVQRLVAIEDGKEATSKRAKLTEAFELDRPAPAERIASILAKMICKERLVKLSGVQSSPCTSSDRETASELLALACEGDQDGIPQIEVAHEALIRNWKEYGKWLDDERKRRRPQWDLERDTKDWAEQGKPGTALYTEYQLSNLQDYQPPSGTLAYEFVTKSKDLIARQTAEEKKRVAREKRVEHEKRLAWAIAAVAGVLLLLVSLATFTLVTYQQFRRSALETAGLLIGRSDQAMISDPRLGVLLSVEATDRVFARRLPLLDSVFGITEAKLGEFKRSLRDAMNSTQGIVKLPQSSESGGSVPDLVSVSPDGQWIAAASGGRERGTSCSVHLWSLASPRTSSPTPYWYDPDSACEPVRMLHFDRGSARLAVVRAGGVIDLIPLDADAPEPKALRVSISGENGEQLEVIAWSPTGRWLAVSEKPGALRLIENDHLDDATAPDRSLVTAKAPFATAQFSPDETWLASVDVSGTLNLWNLLDGNDLLASETLPFTGDQIAFDPNERWFAVATSSDWKVVLWDLHTVGQRGVLPGHSGQAVHSLAFQQSPDSDATFLAVGYENGSILLWDLNTLKVHNADQRAGDTNDQGSSSTSGVSPQVAEEPAWPELDIGQPIGLYEHSGIVDQLVFSAQDADTLISASGDGTARIWDISGKSPELRGTLYSRGDFQAVFFDPHGSNQAHAVEGYMLRHWQDEPTPGDTRELLQQACCIAHEPLDPVDERLYLAVEVEDYESVCERPLFSIKDKRCDLEETK